MFGPDFYPTPGAVAAKMLAKLSPDAVNILEPSAGKGNLAKALVGRNGWHNQRRVDVIESDPDLVSVLRALDPAVNVVGYDWLTYDGVSYYDAIVMNPPFSNGAAHLLKAWQFLHDGEIVCLLNRETLDNPCTKERRELVDIIAAHGHVEQLGQCFRSAERQTDVDVVMVYLKKTGVDDRVEVWATTEGDERPVDDAIDNPEAMPAVLDKLGNLEHYYNQALAEMFKAFAHARKASLFMEALGADLQGGTENDRPEIGEILKLSTKSVTAARAEYARALRRGAWSHVFSLTDFRKWLDSKQTEQLERDVRQNSAIPFTADNIKGTLANVFAQRRRLFEQSAWNVFEALTKHYNGNTTGSADGGTAGHRGWKTNDSYKVNERLVFPYGCTYSKDMLGFSMWHRWNDAGPVYTDLDRVLAVLDGRKWESVTTVLGALESAFSADRHTPRTVESTYFEVRFFKKGTVHLKWKRRDLLEKFNVTAAAGRRWLGHDSRTDAAPTSAPTDGVTCDHCGADRQRPDSRCRGCGAITPAEAPESLFAAVE